jgi:hypothetical protein
VDGDNLSIVSQKFFVKLGNFLFKGKLTLHQIIRTKIFDKMINGVEMELINTRHFWRLLHKSGFTTIKNERESVTIFIKNKLLNDIFEVKGLRKILSQLGIFEDFPQSSKNFNYENLSGIGIRIINKIVKEMSEKKISDVTIFLGRENIEKKNLVAGDKSETIEIVSTDNFLKVIRDNNIMKRWEDLDENLQSFLSLPSTNTLICSEYGNEKLMIRKIKKCILDFQNCDFFGYYGFEPRNENEIDSDDEPDNFKSFATMRNRLTTIK